MNQNKDLHDCAGCTDRRSEGTHAMHTKQHPCPPNSYDCGECYPNQTKDWLEELWEKHSTKGDENNPTDRMYYEQFVDALSTLLDKKQQETKAKCVEIVEASLKEIHGGGNGKRILLTLIEKIRELKGRSPIREETK